MHYFCLNSLKHDWSIFQDGDQQTACTLRRKPLKDWGLKKKNDRYDFMTYFAHIAKRGFFMAQIITELGCVHGWLIDHLHVPTVPRHL